MIELVTTFSAARVPVTAARVLRSAFLRGDGFLAADLFRGTAFLRGDGFLAADLFRGTAFLRGDGFLAADFFRGTAFLRRAAFFFAAMSLLRVPNSRRSIADADGGAIVRAVPRGQSPHRLPTKGYSRPGRVR